MNHFQECFSKPKLAGSEGWQPNWDAGKSTVPASNGVRFGGWARVCRHVRWQVRYWIPLAVSPSGIFAGRIFHPAPSITGRIGPSDSAAHHEGISDSSRRAALSLDIHSQSALACPPMPAPDSSAILGLSADVVKQRTEQSLSQ
jgi:hypothetical protein